MDNDFLVAEWINFSSINLQYSFTSAPETKRLHAALAKFDKTGNLR